MPTETVDVSEARLRLPDLLSLATAETDMMIADHGTPRARLVPVGQGTSTAQQRTAGLNRGAVAWISDDFDAPLPDDLWLGSDLQAQP